MLIRRFRSGDENDVWSLHSRAVVGSGGEAPDAIFSALRDVDGAFLRAGGEFLVAVVDERIVAMGGFVPVSARRAELKGMRVDPEYRRRGIAKELLSRLEHGAVQRGCAVMGLETAAAQRTARKFYEAAGYAEVGGGARADIETVCYEKALAQSEGRAARWGRPARGVRPPRVLPSVFVAAAGVCSAKQGSSSREVAMTDQNVRGRFVWHELATPDQPGALAFYANALGWKNVPWERDPRYSMFAAQSGPLAGAGAAAGSTARWTPFISTGDIDATVRQAQGLGATVTTPVTQIPEAGKYAVLADPQGAAFGVHWSAAAPASEKAPALGEFSWHELAALEHRAAFDFYRALFGWDKLAEHDMGPMGIYLIFGRGGIQLGGMFDKGSGGLPGGANWLAYVRVRDVHATVDRIKRSGGRLATGPMQVPGGDWIAQCFDPAGALFAVHTVAADVEAARPTPPAREKVAEQRSAKKAAAKKKGSKKKAAKKKATKKATKKASKKAAKKKATKKKATKKKPAKKKPAKKKTAKKKVAKKKAAKKKAAKKTAKKKTAKKKATKKRPAKKRSAKKAAKKVRKKSGKKSAKKKPTTRNRSKAAKRKAVPKKSKRKRAAAKKKR